jgi:hypothetical protein
MLFDYCINRDILNCSTFLPFSVFSIYEMSIFFKITEITKFVSCSKFLGQYIMPHLIF